MYSDLAHPTLFDEILQSNLPKSDKNVSRLKDEAAIVVAAGTLTTSWALSVATCHLLASPRTLTKLKEDSNPLYMIRTLWLNFRYLRGYRI